MNILLETDVPFRDALVSAGALQLLLLRHQNEGEVAFQIAGGKRYLLHDELEAVQEKNFVPDGVIFYGLQAPEAERHHELQRRFEESAIELLNPASISSLADSKSFTLKKWQKAGVSCPGFRVFKPGEKTTYRKIKEFIEHRKLQHVFIQADDLTEGLETWHFSATEFRNEADYFQSILLPSLQNRTFLVKEPRGNCYLQHGRKYVPLVWRILYLNVGGEVYDDHGFVQVASHDSALTSIKKGGWIADFSQLQAPINYREKEGFFEADVTGDDMNIIRKRLREAMEVFQKGEEECLCFAGIDFVLERQGDEWNPVFLEINPRCGALNKMGVFQR